MASTRAHRPHEILAAAIAAALASVMTAALLGAIAGSASAASAARAAPGTGPGGAQAGGVSVGSGTAATGSGRSRSAGSSAARTPSAHVTSARITSVTCTPHTRCSANPHQVSVHGTLLLTGRGLRAGLIVAFPARRGARISRSSPGAHLRANAAGLLVSVPSAAHSGNIMVLLGGGRYTSSYGPIYVFGTRCTRRWRPAPSPSSRAP